MQSAAKPMPPLLMLAVCFPYSLCQDMRENEGSYYGSSALSESSSSHLDEFGKRKTIKPASYFSDEDASD